MKKNRIFVPTLAIAGISALYGFAETPKKNVIDEVVWVVGDEAIFRSDVEDMYQDMRQQGNIVSGDPYCVIPEQIAVEKLYLHQAKIDTIEVSESMVRARVDQQINYMVNQLGSKEKVEEYFHKSLPSLRQQYMEFMRNKGIVDEVQRKLTQDVTVTPSEVRKYFDALPQDSVPYIPMKVEAQIITINPNIPRQEIDDIKARLREYADRVNRGDADFSTLAIMFSEDKMSAMQGGELGFMPRSAFVPEFANVAFNLSDPKKVSRIVETEYGYHIMQLIEKRGEQVNVRHILLQPKASSKDLKDAVNRLDSVRKEIVGGSFTFGEAAAVISQDKDTRNNQGIMINEEDRSSRFEMQELPSTVAQMIEKMSPGDVSEAFVMVTKQNKEVAAIVRLTNRMPGHRATLSDDFNLIKKMYENHKKQEILTEWLENKIKETYVRIEDGWNNCEFRYKGWVKESN